MLEKMSLLIRCRNYARILLLSLAFLIAADSGTGGVCAATANSLYSLAGAEYQLYTDSACTTAFNFDSPITQDLTLYAKWTYTGKGPKTGDESNTALWIALACVCAVGLAGTGIALSKRRRRK